MARRLTELDRLGAMNAKRLGLRRIYWSRASAPRAGTTSTTRG